MKSLVYTDRNISSLELYDRVIRKHGFKVKTCKSGLEILVAVEEIPVDLIILDLGIEDISSSTICPLLKRHSCNDHLAILVVCDLEQKKTFQGNLPEGADDFIARPYEIKDLLSKVPVTIAKLQAKLKVARLKARCENRRNNSDFPEKIGPYRILEELGEGANSTVYRAVNDSNNETEDVALKIFDITAYQNIHSSFDAYFLREAYGLSKLTHPNIVRMLDFGKIEQTYYLVMELVLGKSLESLVEESGPMEEKQLASIAFQIASVFKYLEEHNVIHRDVKPGNILICENEMVKLTDFGAAKQRDDITLTRKNDHFMGTPQFVSPEQILAEKFIDTRCDIYSLGATLYFCGTNTMPFSGRNVIEILDDNLNTTPRLISEVNSEISLEFSNLVAKMLEKNLEERCSALELYHSLSKKLGKTQKLKKKN